MDQARRGNGGPDDELELRILGAAVTPRPDGSFQLVLRTTRGDIDASLMVYEGGTAAVVFLSGASGGIDGPAGGVWAKLAPALTRDRVTSLRLQYRVPGKFDECLLDALAAVSFLRGVGARQIALVGHSFGGGVAVRAAGFAPDVTAVAALSSQLHGTEEAAGLSPRPLLIVHGMDDIVLEATASEIIYQRALQPKRLVLYAGAGHALLECQDEVFDLLREWIPTQTGAMPPRGEDQSG